MKKLGKSFKAVAFFAVAVLAGVGTAGKAHAFSFNSGDLVLAMYGNSNEYLVNLGSASALLSDTTPNPISLTPGLAGGAAPVYFSLVEYFISGDFSTINSMVSSASPLSSYSSSELASSDAGGVLNTTAAWQGVANTIVGNTVSAADASNRAWTQNFGTDQMAGNWAKSTRGVFGSTLYLLSGDFFTGEKTSVGTAFLSADGTEITIAGLNVSAVPIPAAVILFGTGLAGLVGVARRKMVAA